MTILRKLLALALLSIVPFSSFAQRTTTNFDSDWSFTLDGKTKTVDLPHDWSVEGKFDKDTPAGNDGGYLPTGKGIYRKTFFVPESDKGRDLSLYFEGVYMNSSVYLNGDSIGGHPYGYSSFFVNLTPHLRYGAENNLEVRVDNSAQKNCRWYSGSGIYRHVWLVNTPATHIDEWGVHIVPEKLDENGRWALKIDVKYTDEASIRPEIRNIVYDAAGKVVASSEGTSQQQIIEINDPALWSPDDPNLYTVCSQLLSDGKVIDEVKNTTGFRTITYNSTDGLKLNDKSIVLNGGCVHHDNGMLGAASYDAAEARKVRLLKEAGFNAVRTSHNLPSPAFLDECDRQGLLVIDEAFDGWRDSKTDYDYSRLFDKWWDKDIEAMVLRDRNHPSVMAWSIGNEVIERKKLEVVTTARKLAEKCRSLDPTRPVTSALASWDADWEIYDPLAAQHDIVGYNYMIHKSESDHERVPERVMWQTESYPRDAFSNWVKVNDNPYIIGDFVWTAIDYLGESGIGRHYYTGEVEGEHYHRPLWPWHGALCGDIDITGMREPISYYRDMLYNTERPTYMAVREPEGYRGEIKETLWGVYPTYETWNWPGHEGKPIEIEIYSHSPRVRLTVNGKPAGEKEVSRGTEFKAVFTVPYQPGEIVAEGISADSTIVDRYAIATAGKPYAIRLSADKTAFGNDSEDLVFVTAEIVDKDGRVVTDSDCVIDFSAAGRGSIIATGSADMKDTESYAATSRRTHMGRAMAVVKAGNKSGNTTVRASSPSLRKGSLKIR